MHLLYRALVLFILGLLAFNSAAAGNDDFAGVTLAKAVWDITTGDEKVFQDRLTLIQKTADSLKKRGIEPKFVLVVHGKATQFITKQLKGTAFAAGKVNNMEQIQTQLDGMSRKGVKIEVCGIAMRRGKITEDNVQPFALIEENVFENLIVLQNKGYAYMPVF